MKRTLLIVTCVAATLASVILSCTHKPYLAPASGNFPPDVASIIVGKCAISGCHNAASYQNANGLLMDTWEHLMNGGNAGAEVIAYSPKFSPLLYFVNTDSTLGTVATPSMPLSTTTLPQSPLTRAEYLTLYNWIAAGAPDKDGNIPFADNPDTRQKIYLTQQGCDLMAVIDAQKYVVMRYIPIGTDSANIESPHCTRVSSDGAYAYVSFLAGQYVQKIDTRTDKIIAAADVGSLLPGGAGGSWNILYVAPGDSMLEVTDWESNGIATTIATNAMQILLNKTISSSGLLVYPHGITSDAAFDTLYITAQYGNTIYKIPTSKLLPKMVSLNGKPAQTTNNNDITSPNPHEILMAPDYSKYFVTCQTTNEVRVLDAHTNVVLDSIPVGTFPQEMAISHTQPYLFVTCMEDAATTYPGGHGSVYVINYNTNQIVQKIYGDFYQPHGVCVDDRNGKVYIASTNANPSGPAPHHATYCGGRAGWYSVYDLNSLQPVNNRRYEVTVMPYSAATRFAQ